MKLNNLKSSFAALGLAFAFVSAPAAAQITYFQPVTTFEDDNIEMVLLDAAPFGELSVGDRLVAVIEWNDTTGILAGQGPVDIGGELTGVADVTVIGFDPVSGRFIFGPTPGGLLSGFGAGTMVAAWTDATEDLNVINASCGTLANCLTLAGLGGADGSVLFMTAGFFGDADASWTYSGGTNYATVQTGAAGTSFGSFSYALDLGINNSGVLFADQPCGVFCAPGGDGLIEIVGSGQVLGGQGLVNDWFARTDADFQVVPAPEPGSLALLGLGLAGLGVLRLRRKLRK